ncbi:hypothetical protein EMIT0P294_270010 [Pseudomonas sp. IT-P294]
MRRSDLPIKPGDFWVKFYQGEVSLNQ